MPLPDRFQDWFMFAASIGNERATGMKPATGGGKYRAGHVSGQDDPFWTVPGFRDRNSGQQGLGVRVHGPIE